jgi:hypothetical protein
MLPASDHSPAPLLASCELPTAQKARRTVIRVAKDTWIVFGELYAFPLFVAMELLKDGQYGVGLACIVAAAAFFSHYALQCIVFEGESMFVRRPLFPGRPILVREISSIVVALKRRNARPYWQCVISGGGAAMCRFNPRKFSLEGMDAIYEEIRRRSPNVEIHDESYEHRRKGRTQGL